jgi:hypothetical protein
MLIYIVLDSEKRLTFDQVKEELNMTDLSGLIAVYDSVADCVTLDHQQAIDWKVGARGKFTNNK